MTCVFLKIRFAPQGIRILYVQKLLKSFGASSSSMKKGKRQSTYVGDVRGDPEVQLSIVGTLPKGYRSVKVYL